MAKIGAPLKACFLVVTYYGYIVDIWELDYRDGFKLPLFKCKWVNMSRVQVDPQYGMTQWI